MNALEIVSQSISKLIDLLIISLSVIKSIIYTNGRLNIIGYVLLILVFITLLEIILNIAFGINQGDDEDD